MLSSRNHHKLLLGHTCRLLSYLYYIPGIFLVWSVWDRFNRNSSADVVYQLWCPAAVDTGGSSEAAAILCTRYQVSPARHCYLPSLMPYTPHMLLLERGDSASKRADYRFSARVWRGEISYLSCIVAQRPGDGDLDCGRALCRCSGRDQTSMGWLTGILRTLHVLAVQRSLANVVRQSQAFHDSMCDYRVMLAIFSKVVANGTCTETGSRRGVNGTRRRQAPIAMWLFMADQHTPRTFRANIMLRIYSSKCVWIVRILVRKL